MKKKAAALMVAVGGVTTAAHATNGDQMLGVTATQWGMAGAIVAAPEDAGTVITNPAGLATIELGEFRADMGFGFLNPPREANGVESGSNLYMIPSGSLAFRTSDKLTIGMGMAGMSGMGVDFDDVMPAVPGDQNVVTTKQFYKIAPGFAYRLTNNLAVGAALNIDYQSLAIDSKDPLGNETHWPQNQVYGFGGSLGLTWRLADGIQFGASYVSEQEMDEFEWNTSNMGRVKMQMNAPAQLALGMAVNLTPTLLLEADVKQIWFSDVLDEIKVKTGMGTNVMAFGWDDQTVYAVALRANINPGTTLRFGYNYGESPIKPEDVDKNIGSLAVTEEHYSVGLTKQLGSKVFGSFSYVHAPENTVKSNTGSGNTISLEQNVVNLQITYRN